MTVAPDIPRRRPVCPQCLSILDWGNLRPQAGRHCRAVAMGKSCAWARFSWSARPATILDAGTCPVPDCLGGPMLMTPGPCPTEIDEAALGRIRNVAILALDGPSSAEAAVAILAVLLRRHPGIRAAPASWREIAAWSPDRLRLGRISLHGQGPFRLHLPARAGEVRLHALEREERPCVVAADQDPPSRALAADDLVLVAGAGSHLHIGPTRPRLRWLREVAAAGRAMTEPLPALWLMLADADLWQRHAGWTGQQVPPAAMEGLVRRVLEAEGALDPLLALPWRSVRFLAVARPLGQGETAALSALVAPLAGVAPEQPRARSVGP